MDKIFARYLFPGEGGALFDDGAVRGDCCPKRRSGEAWWVGLATRGVIEKDRADVGELAGEIGTTALCKQKQNKAGNLFEWRPA